MKHYHQVVNNVLKAKLNEIHVQNNFQILQKIYYNQLILTLSACLLFNLSLKSALVMLKIDKLPSVLFINVLNDLFATFVLKVDIDIWRLITLFRNKSLKQHFYLRRVNRGNT